MTLVRPSGILLFHLGPIRRGKYLETGGGAAMSGKNGLLRLQKEPVL